MLRDNFLREELCDSEAPNVTTIQSSPYPTTRNEIRQQVDGAQSISSYTDGECPHMPRYTTVN
jgi:hypothetical protein